jgi:hypothetical protein
MTPHTTPPKHKKSCRYTLNHRIEHINLPGNHLQKYFWLYHSIPMYFVFKVHASILRNIKKSINDDRHIRKILSLQILNQNFRLYKKSLIIEFLWIYNNYIHIILVCFICKNFLSLSNIINIKIYILFHN